MAEAGGAGNKKRLVGRFNLFVAAKQIIFGNKIEKDRKNNQGD